MIQNLKIKINQAPSLREALKKLEAGDADIMPGELIGQYQLKLEMEADTETIQKVVEFIKEQGKQGIQVK